MGQETLYKTVGLTCESSSTGWSHRDEKSYPKLTSIYLEIIDLHVNNQILNFFLTHSDIASPCNNTWATCEIRVRNFLIFCTCPFRNLLFVN